jgi:hypothetical protein
MRNACFQTPIAGRIQCKQRGSSGEFRQNLSSPGDFPCRLEPPGDSKNLPLRLEISRRSPGGGNAATYCKLAIQNPSLLENTNVHFSIVKNRPCMVLARSFLQCPRFQGHCEGLAYSGPCGVVLAGTSSDDPKKVPAWTMQGPFF